MSDLTYYIAISMMFFGLFFILTAAVGVWRFKDVYLRLHAVTKGATFGFCFVVLGAALLMEEQRDVSKAIVAVIFQFMAAPITGHVIARVAVKKGMLPVKNPKGELMEEKEIPEAPEKHEPPPPDGAA